HSPSWPGQYLPTEKDLVKFPLSRDLSCALRTHYADGEGAAVRLWQLDMTERFLHFYERASRPGTSMDERWRLWRKMGRFAPVPTTPDGMKRAREMFEAVWPRYGQSLDAIAAGGAAVREAPPGCWGTSCSCWRAAAGRCRPCSSSLWDFSKTTASWSAAAGSTWSASRPNWRRRSGRSPWLGSSRSWCTVGRPV